LVAELRPPILELLHPPGPFGLGRGEPLELGPHPFERLAAFVRLRFPGRLPLPQLRQAALGGRDGGGQLGRARLQAARTARRLLRGGTQRFQLRGGRLEGAAPFGQFALGLSASVRSAARRCSAPPLSR
jgi:hypothetical protein